MPFYCEDGQALEQVAQTSCGVSGLGGTQTMSGQDLRNLLWLSQKSGTLIIPHF